MKDFSTLEDVINIVFENKDLLKQAFIHRSYLNEHPNVHMEHNERLEFLGDAVLELIVTEYLYNTYPNPEGELTSWRAALVNSKMLSFVASSLDFNSYILLSRGEQKDTGRARQFILANAVEALIGAIYIEKGYDVSRTFIADHILKELPKILENKLYRDPKSSFQEAAQDKLGITPTYEVLSESGPDHSRTFVVGVYLDKDMISQGEGSSKHEAQEEAAQKGLEIKKW